MRPDLSRYDRVLMAFSGGKDSLAALLHLLDLGVPPERIELHHHDVDGGAAFMDWPCTPAYARALGAAFGVPVYLSWRTGGFAAELGRDGAPTAPVVFETPEGRLGRAGGEGPPGVRGRFPQVCADLRLRWCSSALKIEVMAALIRNQPRFLAGETLVVTGERAEESPMRALRAVRLAPNGDPGPADRPLAAGAVLARGRGVGDHRPLWRDPAPGLRPRMVAGELSQLHLRLAQPMGDAPRPLPGGVPADRRAGGGERPDDPAARQRLRAC